MKNLILKLVPALFLGSIFATATCADPSLAVYYYVGFETAETYHVLRQHYDIVNAGAVSVGYQIQGKSFQAWSTAQDFTVPLWQLVSPAEDDFIFLPSSTGNPPVASGFNAGSIIAYVYPAQTCESVPLLVAQLAAATDHYYTIDPVEHAGLIAKGWTDAGIAGYVLPLTSD